MGESPQASSDGAITGQAKERDHPAAQKRCILRRVSRTCGVGILAQDNVFDPVQPVLYFPVPTHDSSEVRRLCPVAAHIDHALGIGLGTSGAGALDLNDTGQLRPRREGRLLRCGKDPHLTSCTAVARTLGLVVDALRRGRRTQLLCRGEQVRLVCLEGDQVLSASAADQLACFFVQCSASALTPAPAISASSISSSIV